MNLQFAFSAPVPHLLSTVGNDPPVHGMGATTHFWIFVLARLFNAYIF